MKKFECPHCHKNTITALKKAFAGGPASKGTVCPECGGHVTNDSKSLGFKTVVKSVCLLVIIAAVYFDLGIWYCLGAFAFSFVLPWAVNMFCFGTAKTLRNDVQNKKVPGRGE
ncbi:MAG: hypothetical protein LBR54_02105 [Oscillospiraceae bacterium]|jgi:predicted RNA-binding Zn-ribbon protein involved in translation (DUF1610 family)|nr:hypothetical protein [Oscillospiraceae bacterium]